MELKILGMSDSWNTISGFATAMRNIMDGLGKLGHECHMVGWQSFGQPTRATFHDRILNFEGLPNTGGGRFGENALPYWVARIEPDVILTLGDFWMVAWMWKYEYPMGWALLYPIDGYPVTDDIVEMLKKVDIRIAYSQYGKRLVNEKGISTHMIPHGVSLVDFHPLSEPERMMARDEYRVPKDAWVVNCVTRNQERKMLDILVKAFIPFHKQFPNTILFFHTDKKDREGWDLPFILKRFGLQEGRDVLFTPPDKMRDFMTGVDFADLNKIYNLGNPGVHCIPSGGEGFGLPWIESQSAGVVNIAPDYTTAYELFEDNYRSGVLVKVDPEDFIVGGAGVDRSRVKVDRLYGVMKWCYENPDEMEVLRKNSLCRAKEYDWETKIVPLFDKLLRETVTEYKR